MAAVVPDFTSIFKSSEFGSGNWLSPPKVLFIKQVHLFYDLLAPADWSFYWSVLGHGATPIGRGTWERAKEQTVENGFWVAKQECLPHSVKYLRQKKPSPCLKEVSFVLQGYKDLYKGSDKLQLPRTKIYSSLKCKSISCSEPSPRRDKIRLLSQDLGDGCSVIIFLAGKAA